MLPEFMIEFLCLNHDLVQAIVDFNLKITSSFSVIPQSIPARRSRTAPSVNLAFSVL